ncbi:hypothetical protein [uncultured Enterovirga sp.]|uniref:PIN-like domain-containing protein n=1 Tax=uncultured Enterovirga sp. TaxID=2026352 RepID=UPI0035CAB508
MRLLLDHNISPRIARALAALFSGHHEVVALRERFHPRATDVEWITALDRDGGWAVLTQDLRLRTRPHERLAMDRARIVFFFMDGAWRKFDVAETAARLIRLVPKMSAQVELTERGRFHLPINAGSKLRPHRD